MYKKLIAASGLARSLSACNDTAAPTGQISAPVVAPNPNPLVALPEPSESGGLAEAQDIRVEILTPQNQHSWDESESDAPFSRKVAAKTFSLRQFTRTLEETKLKVRVTLAPAALKKGKVHLALMQGGNQIDDATIDPRDRHPENPAELEFETPKLSKAQRGSGFAKVNYDLFVDNDAGRSHQAFSFLIYDGSQPSLVVPRQTPDCLVYHQPERASGCYQNRTRSTQEVVFTDNVLQHHETDVTFSGGLNIAVGVVTLQLGGQVTTENGTDTSRGSEIHFTNCIECASVIYRQQVDTMKDGDVYQVMADGTTTWMGSTVMSNSAVAYEFASTGSESNNYRCDVPSQLPVGATPSCESR